MAFPEVIDVLRAMDETEMGNALNEGLRCGDVIFLDEVGPELLGDFEGFVDLEGLLHVDGAVRFLRGVVELAECGMAGARVVPSIGAFGGDVVEAFKNLDGQIGLQFLEQDAEGGAHDARADEDDIGTSWRGGIHAGSELPEFLELAILMPEWVREARLIAKAALGRRVVEPLRGKGWGDDFPAVSSRQAGTQPPARVLASLRLAAAVR